MEPWTLSHFRVLGKLGSGGMGVVYEARDIALGRMVALKMLPDELSEDASALERFRREAQAVSALNHPHICTLYEIGEDSGRHFLAMERLEGQTLKQRIERGGALSSREAARYGAEIADALEAAHAAGIVHRDLKSSNVFLTRRGTKLLDFGVAKVTTPVHAPPGEETRTQIFQSTLTETGSAVGTLGYMSPEQLRGERVDARSDLFSLGVLLYEMVTGEPPFSGGSLAEVLQKVLGVELPAPRKRDPSITRELEGIILRALQRSAADRYQTATEMRQALSATIHGGATRSSVEGTADTESPAPTRAPVTATDVRRTLPSSPEAARAGNRLAVLPFENLGPADDEYFADGVTDDVRALLASFPGIEVIARGSATQYKGTSKSPDEIAAELGVRYLLTGRIRWQKSAGQPSRIRVSPELVEVGDYGAPTTRWQDTWDAVLEDVFAVQDEMARKAAEALGVALETGAGGSARPDQSMPDLAAYDLYLQAMDISDGADTRSPQMLAKACELYERAVAIDPGFALAWARLSMVRSGLFQSAVLTRALEEAALAAAETAARLAPDRLETRLAKGYYYYYRQDYPSALRELQPALEQAPDNAALLLAVALNEQASGSWVSGTAHLRQAALLDPRSANVAERVGRAELWQRHYDQARELLVRACTLAPTSVSPVEHLAMVYLAQGDLEGARSVFREAAGRIPMGELVVFFASFWDLGWVLDDEQQRVLLSQSVDAFSGNEAFYNIVRAEVLWLRGELGKAKEAAKASNRARPAQIEEAPSDAQVRALYAVTLAMVGERDEAIAQAERALELKPLSSDAWAGTYAQHQAAIAHGLIGDSERALDLLEPLLEVPYFLSPGWLSIDPHFDMLRGEPRFRSLCSQGS